MTAFMQSADIKSYEVTLNDFVDDFGSSLLDSLNQSTPAVYTGNADARRTTVMDGLKRQPFQAQAEVVQAVSALLVDQGEQAAIINAEMGTGKTMMAIALSAVLYAEGYRRNIVISPPHLVYKWRREILETIPNARVWVLNGPDTLAKLLKFRDLLNEPEAAAPEFFILGRVRMRMGFHWRPVAATRRMGIHTVAACPDCGQVVYDIDGDPVLHSHFLRNERRNKCLNCHSPLWTLMRPGRATENTQRATVLKALKRIPTIGKVSAEKLVNVFGEDFLASLLADNIHEFINLMDANGELIFSDRQAVRMERGMANIEFGFGEGGYQPTEFIKRYLPKGIFDLLIVDEGHEYKNSGSAQGQAMGVLASQVRKTILLTGTLMGGYADDLFYLLFRALTRRMIEDGYKPNRSGSLGSASMSFMRDHGILKDM